MASVSFLLKHQNAFITRSDAFIKEVNIASKRYSDRVSMLPGTERNNIVLFFFYIFLKVYQFFWATTTYLLGAEIAWSV
jgi:hypothetical protein